MVIPDTLERMLDYDVMSVAVSIVMVVEGQLGEGGCEPAYAVAELNELVGVMVPGVVR